MATSDRLRRTVHAADEQPLAETVSRRCRSGFARRIGATSPPAMFVGDEEKRIDDGRAEELSTKRIAADACRDACRRASETGGCMILPGIADRSEPCLK